MKNAIKVLWLVIAGTLIFGLVLMAIGFAAGATPHLRVTPQGVKLVGDHPSSFQKTEPNAAAFKNVEIDLPATWTSITFEESDHYGYAINIPTDSSYQLSDAVEGDTLRIGQERDLGYWGDLNLNWSGLNSLVNGWADNTQQGTIVVSVPKGTQLDTVSLKLAAGRYVIGPVTARDVSVSCPAGETKISKISATKVDLDVAGGSMRATGIKADILTGSLSAGELYVLETDARMVSLDGSAGHLRFSGDATEQLGVELSAGSAELDLARPRNAYALTTDVSAGSIRVNGESIGGLREIDPELTPLNARTSAGTINLSFQ
ncbi:MAG: DUF4097 domain-containing protein [Coriobacteriia bacterium]|nr:DUF4097 domain-containing protein [Coriobacteriia bacterium]